jgi:hypothetical protein
MLIRNILRRLFLQLHSYRRWHFSERPFVFRCPETPRERRRMRVLSSAKAMPGYVQDTDGPRIAIPTDRIKTDLKIGPKMGCGDFPDCPMKAGKM